MQIRPSPLSRWEMDISLTSSADSVNAADVNFDIHHVTLTIINPVASHLCRRSVEEVYWFESTKVGYF